MKSRLLGAFTWKRIGGVALVMLALVAGLLLAQGNGGSGLLAYLPFLLILACPLMMIFMGSMGRMEHDQSGLPRRHDGINDAMPDPTGMTRDEQVWTLHNELTRMAWRQESLRQELERLEHDHAVDADETATVR